MSAEEAMNIRLQVCDQEPQITMFQRNDLRLIVTKYFCLLGT